MALQYDCIFYKVNYFDTNYFIKKKTVLAGCGNISTILITLNHREWSILGSDKSLVAIT